MELDTYYELARRSIIITKSEETTLSWGNSSLAVRKDKGIHFFDFSFNLNCTEKSMDFLETVLASPKSSPAKSLFTYEYLKKEKRNIETTEMILNPALWPHNDQLNYEMVNVRSMKWSPKGFIGNNETTLAILNDAGGVELFVLRRCEWISIFDFSPNLQQYFVESMKSPENYEQLKDAVYTVEPSAICWAPESDGNSIYFVTAQKNHKILFWQLVSKDEDIKGQVIGETQCDVSEIVSLIWIPKANEQFVLICTDILGQIIALECKKENNTIQHLESHSLWPHKDKMIAKHLQYFIMNDKIIIICNKYRHLLVLMFDENFKKLSQYLNNINDYRITDICKSMDGIYLTTVNNKLYKVYMNIKDNNIIVNLDVIKTKDIYPTQELFGITFSPNNVLCVVGFIDTKISCRKKNAHIDVMFLTSDRKIDSIIPALLNNPTKKLTDFWDCIEILRCRAMKLCQMPALDYNKLYLEGETDVYILKLYLVFLILFNNLKKRFKISAQEPTELSEVVVKEKILAHQATKLISNISDNYKNNGMLSEFEKESLNGARKYLDFFRKKHNQQINVTTDNLVDVKCEFEYTCQCCNETLTGFSCKNNHLNMFCSLTFTPIKDIDYLACKSCNTTARIELYADKPMCVYCDLYLNLIYV